jgi:hypothetical protein
MPQTHVETGRAPSLQCDTQPAAQTSNRQTNLISTSFNKQNNLSSTGQKSSLKKTFNLHDF